MIKTKVAFLEGQLFSSQSELFEYFFNCFDWLDWSLPSQKPLLFWSSWQAMAAIYFCPSSRTQV